MPDKTLEEKIDSIVNAITTLDPLQYEEGERLLASINTEEELNQLAKVSFNSSFKVKYYIIKHLSLFDNISVLNNLIVFLTDKNKTIKNLAQRALLQINTDEKYDLVIPLITKGDKAIKLFVIKLLGEKEQINSVLPLIEALKDEEDPSIRVQIIDSLRLIGDPRSNNTIIKFLKDKNEVVKYAASFYCGSRKVLKSCKNLLNLAKQDSPKIRAIAVWALGQIGNKDYIKEFKNILSVEEDINVRNEAYRVLRRTGLLKLYGIDEAKKLCTYDTKCIKHVSDWLLLTLPGTQKPKEADICLFLEGTYPYVKGGVSSWVNDLLNYFDDKTFSIVHLAASSSEVMEFKYELPDNVLYFNEIFLYDLPYMKPSKDKTKKEEEQRKFDYLFDFLTSIEFQTHKDFLQLCRMFGVYKDFKINLENLMLSRQAWKFLRKFYDSYLEEVPFLEYMWTYRSITLPIYHIVRSKIPPASLYYSPLTGYSGIAAMLAKVIYNKPLMITEHGIYHRERTMEIDRSSWIYEMKPEGFVLRELFGGMKKIWIDMYLTISSLIYKFADAITTLHKGNKQIQIEAGAVPDKISIIPNGIDPSLYSHISKEGIENKEKFVVGLVGRVVAIKDIKTFIWASKLVNDQLKGKVEFWIMGPYGEEKEYTDECFALVNLLDMKEHIKFTGNVNLREYFKKVDLVVLTSISEGQPLSVMEAMAAGIPNIATNVGSCKDLLYGKDSNDQRLGRCGIITNVHSPNETARAIISILTDFDQYNMMSAAGRKRINKYYIREKVFEMYRKKFDQLIENE